MFYKVGGGTRLSGLMLAGATFAILSFGIGIVGYLRTLSKHCKADRSLNLTQLSLWFLV